MTITLFVGDNDTALSDIAKKYESNAFLIHFGNYQTFLDTQYTTDIVVYSALADLPKVDDCSIMHKILLKADKIFYNPPLIWSDHCEKFLWDTQKKYLEFLLYDLSIRRNNVHGLDLTSYQNTFYLELLASRPPTKTCLWIAGCSIAHGAGVAQHEKFGSIISDKINIPASYLTKVGSSIEWAADQILRSDIQSNDIIIWALTGENRAPAVKNHTITYESDPNLRLDETRLYKSITSIHQVINFCKKISCQLIMFPTICSPNLRLLLVDCKNYYHVPYQVRFVDHAADNLHPGPKQHQYWADFCLDLID
jgi:hypothetical protein